MGLNPSGPISLSGSTAGVSIAAELGIGPSTTISLTDSNVRTLAGVASGPITMPGDFYGKANEFTLTYSANTSNVDVRTAALAAGWNGTTKLNVVVNSGVIIFSTSTGSYAMTVSGSFPGGVTLTNNGTILGRGGNGAGAPNNGSAGGPALLVQSSVTINNGSGRIAGGGGGGGGGSTYSYCTAWDGECACCVGSYVTETGGGGGGGIGGSSGGAGGSWGAAGGAGTLTAAGSGGPAGGGGQSNYVGAGGAGGTYGSSGGNGCNGSYGGGCGVAAGLGGAAGAAVVGNSNITWTATGTRNGSIS